ncbi:MAG: hypothetical protein EP216_03950 [Epsilonproteobacteria bacterium]|nr:MAG: hypothetical protein EP216_03950 [Campylobacterota bacterium]
MKTIAFLLLMFSLTACSQNVGYGIGVAGVSSSGDSIAGTQIHVDSETGMHGSVSAGTWF